MLIYYDEIEYERTDVTICGWFAVLFHSIIFSVTRYSEYLRRTIYVAMITEYHPFPGEKKEESDRVISLSDARSMVLKIRRILANDRRLVLSTRC